MRRLAYVAAAAVGLGVAACAVYVRPSGISDQRAIEIAYEFTRSRGLNPSGTQYASYSPGRGFWRVSLWLGPPSCGVARMHVDAFNQNVFDFHPILRPCGGPPPVIEEDRSDL